MSTAPGNDGHTPTPKELREQVEGTREELGQTIEVLAGKADIKGRAKGKAATLTQQAKDKALHTKEQARNEVAEAARSDLAHRAATVARAAEHKTPAPVRDKAQQITQTARHRPGALVAAGAVALLALITARRTRRHR